jgi:hypothetical protein
MPPGSECRTPVYLVRNGYVRANDSWFLSRLLCDFECWTDNAVHDKLSTTMIDRDDYMKSHAREGTKIPLSKKTGLCISIYEPSKVRKAGVPVRALVYWSGSHCLIALTIIYVTNLSNRTEHYCIPCLFTQRAASITTAVARMTLSRREGSRIETIMPLRWGVCILVLLAP